MQTPPPQLEVWRVTARLIIALTILICTTVLTLHLLSTDQPSELRISVVGLLLALVKALGSLIEQSTALVARRHIR